MGERENAQICKYRLCLLSTLRSIPSTRAPGGTFRLRSSEDRLNIGGSREMVAPKLNTTRTGPRGLSTVCYAPVMLTRRGWTSGVGLQPEASSTTSLPTPSSSSVTRVPPFNVRRGLGHGLIARPVPTFP